MKLKTKIRAGSGEGSQGGTNHNSTLIRAPKLKIKTKIRAGSGEGSQGGTNHNGTLVRA